MRTSEHFLKKNSGEKGVICFFCIDASFSYIIERLRWNYIEHIHMYVSKFTFKIQHFYPNEKIC